jgi:hypothetical protein
MTNRTRLAVLLFIASSLALPVAARAQAHSRSGGDSGGDSSAPSGGGSDSGGRVAPEGSSGPVAMPRAPMPEAPTPSAPAERSTRSAEPADRSSSPMPVVDGRNQGDRPGRGFATGRRPGEAGGNIQQFNRRSYPYGYDSWWYGPSFGFYDLWFGSAYTPYGFGYYPYGFNPDGVPYRPYGPGLGYGMGYGYDYGGFGGGYGGYGGSNSGGYSDDDVRDTGAVRLRVNPEHAQVFVDGALAGTVDDFDGLGRHLTLDTGSHQIELRAPGYEPYSMDVVVAKNKTITTRVNLKKK